VLPICIQTHKKCRGIHLFRGNRPRPREYRVQTLMMRGVKRTLWQRQSQPQPPSAIMPNSVDSQDHPLHPNLSVNLNVWGGVAERYRLSQIPETHWSAPSKQDQMHSPHSPLETTHLLPSSCPLWDSKGHYIPSTTSDCSLNSLLCLPPRWGISLNPDPERAGSLASSLTCGLINSLVPRC
jgi:hypothetical protein